MPRWLTGTVVLAALQMSVTAQDACYFRFEYKSCCDNPNCKWIEHKLLGFTWDEGCVYRENNFLFSSSYDEQESQCCDLHNNDWSECCNGEKNFGTCQWDNSAQACVEFDGTENNGCSYEECYKASNQTECCVPENEMCKWIEAEGRCAQLNEVGDDACPSGGVAVADAGDAGKIGDHL